MSEWEVKTVRREHTIGRQWVEVFDVEGTGQMEIWSMQEKYIGRVADSWRQTASGKIVQECDWGVCETHELVTKFSKISPNTPAEDWRCTKCVAACLRKKQRVQSKVDYQKQFPKRIMKFSRALRKRHPELNSRKSRINNDVIVNDGYWGGDAVLRKKINICGYEYNLHVNSFYGQDDNEGVNRVRFSVIDISPMFDEHFRDHGHKGGIKKDNR